MKNFLNSIPTTFIGWATSLVILCGAIFFIFSRKRQSDMEILRATNKDQGDRITVLESAVTRLEGQIQDLQHQNKTLNDLVIVALKQYFFENPKVAESMKDTILKT